jgi:uncharacterized membrane protein
MRETFRRSIVKAVVWRALGVVILGVLTWYYTRSWEVAAGVNITFNAIRVGLYVVHERLWDRVEWGKVEGQPAAKVPSLELPTEA